MSDILASTIATIAKLGADAVTTESRIRTDVVTIVRDDGCDVAVPVVIGPSGCTVNQAAIEAGARLMPPRRTGLYSFADIESLITFTRRFITGETMAYFTAPNVEDEAIDGAVVVVFDDLAPEGLYGELRAFRAKVPFEFGPAVKRYLDLAGEWLSAEVFLGFVDERTDDLVTADLVSMISNVSASTSTSWTRKVDPNTGRVSVKVEDESGPTIAVPRRFSVRIPIFSFDRASDVAELACTLRTRVKGKQLEFCFQFVDLPERVTQAVQVTKDAFQKALPEVPAFLGAGPL